MMFWGSGAMIPVADAAVRGLLAACAVGAGLWLLRTRNVVAQKTAWTLVLAGALLMPLLAPWAARQSWLPRWLPNASALTAQLTLRTETWMRSFKQRQTTASVAPAREEPSFAAAQQVPLAVVAQSTMLHELSGPLGPQFPARAVQAYAKRQVLPVRMSAMQAVCALYLAVCAALLMRLVYGLGATMRLWVNSSPVEIVELADADFPVRVHGEIASPVTIGSGILLPAEYTEWDAEKLRIVLAHESSHVRQWDFYLQLAAGVYAAIFWFSPLGWWLKRRLSDLSEAISDRAAVAQAESRASYAQILLEFATQAEMPQFGVAMARAGRISQRIERLLNENSFRQAFAGGPVRLLTAAVLAPAAVFAATALVRAQAAPVQTPVTGVSHPENTPITVPADASAARAPRLQQQPTTEPVPAAPLPAPAPVAPVEPSGSEGAKASAQADGDSSSSVDATDTDEWESHSIGVADTDRPAYSYAVVDAQDGHGMTFSGDWNEDTRRQIEEAKRIAHDNFLWFAHDGKAYVIDDPAKMARFAGMQAQMKALGAEQETYGKQQEELGRQQAEIARQMEQVRTQHPDLDREMERLRDEMSQVRDQIHVTANPEQIAELSSKIGELAGKMGELQGEMAAKQAEIGALQGALGRQQGRLGEIQGRLGAEQGRIGHEMEQRIQEMIHESLRDGKARPVD